MVVYQPPRRGLLNPNYQVAHTVYYQTCYDVSSTPSSAARLFPRTLLPQQISFILILKNRSSPATFDLPPHPSMSHLTQKKHRIQRLSLTSEELHVNMCPPDY